MLILTDEELQLKLCSNSRSNPNSNIASRMGGRLLKNLQEAVVYFEQYKEDGVLDVGCGDGLGMEYLKERGFTVKGIEFCQARVAVAIQHGLDVAKGALEEIPDFFKPMEANIFCSHVLEHTKSLEWSMKILQEWAKDLIYILVPIEFKDKSSNAAHFSAIKNLEKLKVLVDKKRWQVIWEEYRSSLEPEGLLILKRI
jgi:hypothetical protein